MSFLSGRTSLTTVQTGDLADDAVTLAKLAAGTDGNLISFDTSGDPVAVATGTDGQVLTSSGANAVCAFEDAAGGITLGTEQAHGSGTSLTFSSIPSGTKRVTINFEDLSWNANQDYLIQLGDSGGIETSGYISTSLLIDTVQTLAKNDTTGFGIYCENNSNSYNMHGTMVLTLKDASNFTWTAFTVVRFTATTMCFSAGNKSLSAELTQFKIFNDASGSFSSGSVNVTYE